MGLAFGADNGRTVQFGRYYEDKAGKKLTPIEWTVLDEKERSSLYRDQSALSWNTVSSPSGRKWSLWKEMAPSRM